jgi:hypothetical protein
LKNIGGARRASSGLTVGPMRSLGYEVVLFTIAIVVVALIWSLLTEWAENRARRHADRRRQH